MTFKISSLPKGWKYLQEGCECQSTFSRAFTKKENDYKSQLFFALDLMAEMAEALEQCAESVKIEADTDNDLEFCLRLLNARKEIVKSVLKKWRGWE